ncbi:MAG: aminotransferase class V-fold PLP-dependent enzyme [Ignavibacteriales bacterium]
MKNFLTSYDIEVARSQGKSQLVVDDGTVVTSVAQETADRLGIALVYGRRFKGAEERGAGAGSSGSGSTSDAAGAAAGEINGRRTGYEGAYGRVRGSLGDPGVVEAWRKEFPILARIIHVGNCSQSPQSLWVRRGIETYLDNWLTVGMDWNYWIQEVNLAKAEFAKLINAEPDEIAVSTSVSEAVASVASGLDMSGKRRKIVATEAEFPTVGHVWLGHQKYGCKVEFVPVRDGEVKIEDYERYVDGETLVTSVTHVYYQTGFKQDLEKIGEIAHSKGSIMLVDAYQSLGTVPVDVKALDIDILTSGNLKYLLGIPGIAFLYVKKDLVPRLKPAVTGWFGQENPFAFKVHYLDYASDARRFDTGTPPVMPAFAARAGMEIINAVGPREIGRKIEELSAHCIDGIRRRGLALASPVDPKRKGSTTSVKVPDPHAVEEALKERGIIASARGDVIRVAPHFFTRPEDIDTVLDEIQDVLRG